MNFILTKNLNKKNIYIYIYFIFAGGGNGEDYSK